MADIAGQRQAAAPGFTAMRPDRAWWPLAVAFGITFALQAYLVFAKSINWDEFFHFHHIYELRSGTLTRSLQVLYIRWFGWLFDLPIDPLGQLLVGRLALLPCMAVIAAAIFGLVSQFAGRRTAALCALAYVTGGYVFLHGFAFRADPQATALLMTALWLFFCRKLGPLTIVATAAMLALATMITVKSVFYAPAFAGLFWLRLGREGEGRGFILRCGAILGLAALLFALLFLLHGSTLATAPVNASGRELASAGNAVFAEGLFPQGFYLIRQFLIAPYLTAAIALAPLLWRRRPVAERIALVGLLLPLVTLIFYRNSYPYYFVFILAPAAVAAFPAIEWLARRFGTGLCISALTANALLLTVIEPKETIATQRSVSVAVHQLFPQPVHYVDFCGFIGDFPRAFRFLTSGWGLKLYRMQGEPVLVPLMARESVPLLIDNHVVIDAVLHGRDHDELLLPADAKLLRDNFIPHWGPIWVAGKRIPAGAAPLTIHVAVPGVYTVEGAPITIGGRRLAVGDVIDLARGPHRIEPGRKRDARLRWGDHLPVPAGAPPQQPYFTNY